MTLGEWGENLAAQFLKKKGYLIVERNFRCKMGEVDIIALDGAKLVFVEVKTRTSQAFGLPCEAVNKTKIQHIKRTANYYMAIHSSSYKDARIDVIEILRSEGKAYLRQTRNVTG